MFRLGLGVILGTLAFQAAALEIYIDQDSTFKYINASSATTIGAPAADWYTSGFDDSSWYEGPAPFSSGATSSTIGNLANVADPFDGPADPIPTAYTYWQVNYDPYLRTTFNLTEQTDLTVWLAVDNGINSMYINGTLATAGVNAEGAAFRWEHVFDIDAAYTVVGENTFALQLEDHGGATGFVMMITGDAPGTQTEFTTNPPAAVPAPGSLGLLVLSLLGVVATRKART
ncbi:MAG: hypothetical protein ACFHX7_17695 [Pseudomonadota bacterium]